MGRKLFLTLLVLVAALAFAGVAAADGPNFGEAIFADGQAWGTKGLNPLPPPNGHNDQSFDKLFIFTNGADGQLAVSEAGPGNRHYNGGRWYAHTATWTDEFVAGGDVPVVMSYEDILYHVSAGHLEVSPGHPAGGANYFLCPLLPAKDA